MRAHVCCERGPRAVRVWCTYLSTWLGVFLEQTTKVVGENERWEVEIAKAVRSIVYAEAEAQEAAALFKRECQI